jgi:division protein CdvB (Snf7/Vps24/ESCRT-III family)
MIAERNSTLTRKLAKLIKQIMKMDAAKERLKERLTMIQMMLICLEKDTRRSKVSLQNVPRGSCGCMQYICIRLNSV